MYPFKTKKLSSTPKAVLSTDLVARNSICSPALGPEKSHILEQTRDSSYFMWHRELGFIHETVLVFLFPLIISMIIFLLEIVLSVHHLRSWCSKKQPPAKAYLTTGVSLSKAIQCCLFWDFQMIFETKKPGDKLLLLFFDKVRHEICNQISVFLILANWTYFIWLSSPVPTCLPFQQPWAIHVNETMGCWDLALTEPSYILRMYSWTTRHDSKVYVDLWEIIFCATLQCLILKNRKSTLL